MGAGLIESSRHLVDERMNDGEAGEEIDLDDVEAGEKEEERIS